MQLEMGQCPRELEYVNLMKLAGVRIGLSDYWDIAAINRDDLALWSQAEAQRAEDEAKLRRNNDQR